MISSSQRKISSRSDEHAAAIVYNFAAGLFIINRVNHGRWRYAVHSGPYQDQAFGVDI